jgi:hypothetical protein
MHSPDGQWWWDGKTWRPTVSPDGTQWFDGAQWRRRDAPTGKQRNVSRTVIAWLIAVGVILVVAFLALSVTGFYLYASHDRIDLLDLPEVSDAAETGCQDVTEALTAPGGDRAERITQGNGAIERLIDRLTALGVSTLHDDSPSLQWLDDWRAIASARDNALSDLRLGGPGSFTVPMTEDGYPITDRMTWASPPACARAVELAASP